MGDYNPEVTAHRAIDRSIAALSAEFANLRGDWVHTSELAAGASVRLDGFHGVWVVPASPYSSTNGALDAIRHARQTRIPFLGTCGGFQHAVVEFCRNVLGMTDADHAENNPSATNPVITLLSCALVEAEDVVRLTPGSTLASVYKVDEISAEYRCRYGLNSHIRSALEQAGLRVVAEDEDHEVRAIELTDHPFFIATLFQPERAVLFGEPSPLVRAFVAAADRYRIAPLAAKASSSKGN